MRRERDWRGITAAVLAVGVVAAVIVGEVFAALNPARIVSLEEVATVATVLGAAIGAIATYLGTKPRPKRRNDPPAAPGSTEPGEGGDPGITRPPARPGPEIRS